MDVQHHSKIVGNKGKMINELRKETGCLINMPDRKLRSDEIEIIGPNKQAVEGCIERMKGISSSGSNK